MSKAFETTPKCLWLFEDARNVLRELSYQETLNQSLQKINFCDCVTSTVIVEKSESITFYLKFCAFHESYNVHFLRKRAMWLDDATFLKKNLGTRLTHLLL